MEQNKLEKDDFEKILKMLERSRIGGVVSSFMNIYLMLKQYDISEQIFLDSFNSIIVNTIEDCGNKDWWNYFDETELLEEIIVYRTNKVHDFPNILNKFTDRSTTEIRELIQEHCLIFNKSLDEFEKYV